MKKFKDYFNIILFSAVVFIVFGAFIIMPDGDVSYAERRKLEQFPEITAKNFLSREFSEELEGYFLDQFPIREKFRYMNSFVRMSMLHQLDVNGLWVEKGHIFKYDGDFDKKQVEYGCSIINKVTESYLDDANVYYSIIPDKSYFAENGKGKFDYNALFDTLKSGVENAQYIDIFDLLTLDDYYRTDSHWSQDRILPVAQRLASRMGKETPDVNYEKKVIDDFYGVYFGQAAFSGIEPDKINYLTNDVLENAKVYGIPPRELLDKFGVEDTLSEKVYALDKLGGMDNYDIFLSGGQSLVTAELPEGNGKELIIFRDSFSSSLAPLMLGAYQKVTLVDLRYIPVRMLSQYVDFNENQDVLFLYSASMLNSSMLFRQ